MAGSSSPRAEALMKKLGLTYDGLVGIRFAINVAIATTIVWLTLKYIGDRNPIWAIASMVAASDPEPLEAKRMFKARLANVLIGCAVGLLFLIIGGMHEWLLPFALATCVLVCTFIIRIKTMWRQAPITAAIVIAASVMQNSGKAGLLQGFHKVLEVVFGCLVGIGVSWAMSKIWLVKRPVAVEEKTPIK